MGQFCTVFDSLFERLNTKTVNVMHDCVANKSKVKGRKVLDNGGQNINFLYQLQERHS
jgi:hypothetical protein